MKDLTNEPGFRDVTGCGTGVIIDRDRYEELLEVERACGTLIEQMSLPDDVARLLCEVGRVEWHRTEPQSAEKHGADTREGVVLTAERFEQSGPQVMHWVAARVGDEHVAVATVGTSPNSPAIARVLTGLWNHAVAWAEAQCAVEHRDLEGLADDQQD